LHNVRCQYIGIVPDREWQKLVDRCNALKCRPASIVEAAQVSPMFLSEAFIAGEGPAGQPELTGRQYSVVSPELR
jgi:hypothetical protein